ncbi:MAG TPA: hypothetical protein VH877_16365 [Polyangia bacterium]|nr:hypothetical protein [Polyangia bacterium]
MARPGDDLYALPLDEFTSARDALAKKLRAEGRRGDATRVKALRKPTVVTWALDQVARQRPELIAALLDAGARLVEAQRAVLAGSDAAVLAQATKHQHTALAEVQAAARALLANGGQAPSEAVLRRIHAVANAVALGGDELRDRLRRGVLAEEIDAGIGFDALAGMPIAPRPAAPPPPRPRERARPNPSPAPRSRPDGPEAAERRRLAEEHRARRLAEEHRARRLDEARRARRELAEQEARAAAQAAEKAEQEAHRIEDEARRAAAAAARAREQAASLALEAERARERAKAAREGSDAAAHRAHEVRLEGG